MPELAIIAFSVPDNNRIWTILNPIPIITDINNIISITDHRHRARVKDNDKLTLARIRRKNIRSYRLRQHKVVVITMDQDRPWFRIFAREFRAFFN